MVVLLCYAVVCLLMARHDAKAIYNAESVHHDRNALYHAVAWTVAAFITLFTHAWYLLACMPFIGRVVFDVALNRMRRLDWDYVSPWLLSKSPAIRRKVSAIDRMEYSVFKSARAPKIIYITIILTLIILHYVKITH